MTEADLEARLRAALTLDLSTVPDGVDMSATAVTHRLREACEMSGVCLRLVEVGRNAPE